MSNNPAKHEVLLKQYLCSWTLDISDENRSTQENFARSRNKSDCWIYWILSTYELKKSKIPFSRALKIVQYKFSAKIKCCLFIMFSRSWVSRPRDPTFSCPKSPSLCVPWPPRPMSWRLQVPMSHVIIILTIITIITIITYYNNNNNIL